MSELAGSYAEPRKEGWFRRNAAGIGRGIMLASGEAVGLSPEVAAQVGMVDIPTEVAAEAHRRDLSDLGIPTPQHDEYQRLLLDEVENPFLAAQ